MAIAPARVAAYLAGFSSLFAALAPAVANLDWTSTAGVLGGAATIAAVYTAWAKGRREFEAREHLESLGFPLLPEIPGVDVTPEPPDAPPTV